MPKYIRGAIGALVLASVLVLAGPAEAHTFDSVAVSTCQAERVEWTASSYTTHAHLNEVGEGWAYVDYHCCLDLYGLSHRWMFATRWWNNATTSHDWSPAYSGDCP